MNGQEVMSALISIAGKTVVISYQAARILHAIAQRRHSVRKRAADIDADPEHAVRLAIGCVYRPRKTGSRLAAKAVTPSL